MQQGGYHVGSVQHGMAGLMHHQHVHSLGMHEVDEVHPCIFKQKDKISIQLTTNLNNHVRR